MPAGSGPALESTARGHCSAESREAGPSAGKLLCPAKPSERSSGSVRGRRDSRAESVGTACESGPLRISFAPAPTSLRSCRPGDGQMPLRPLATDRENSPAELQWRGFSTVRASKRSNAKGGPCAALWRAVGRRTDTNRSGCPRLRIRRYRAALCPSSQCRYWVEPFDVCGERVPDEAGSGWW